jgi:hypothetical protein
MPDTSQIKESLQKQLTELEKIRLEEQKKAERTTALIAELQSKLKALEKKRGVNSVAQSLLQGSQRAIDEKAWAARQPTPTCKDPSGS